MLRGGTNNPIFKGVINFLTFVEVKLVEAGNRIPRSNPLDLDSINAFPSLFFGRKEKRSTIILKFAILKSVQILSPFVVP